MLQEGRCFNKVQCYRVSLPEQTFSAGELIAATWRIVGTEGYLQLLAGGWQPIFLRTKPTFHIKQKLKIILSSSEETDGNGITNNLITFLRPFSKVGSFSPGLPKLNKYFF